MKKKENKCPCDDGLPDVEINCGNPQPLSIYQLKEKRIKEIIEYFEDELKNYFYTHDSNCGTKKEDFKIYLKGAKSMLRLIDEDIQNKNK